MVIFLVYLTPVLIVAVIVYCVLGCVILGVPEISPVSLLKINPGGKEKLLLLEIAYDVIVAPTTYGVIVSIFIFHSSYSKFTYI